MAGTKKSKKKSTQQEKAYCIACQKEHSKSEFYQSYNPIHTNSLIPYCKKWIKQTVRTEDGEIDVELLKDILRQVDLPFLKDYWNAACKGKEETVGRYFKDLKLQQNRSLTWKDSIFENKSNDSDKFNVEDKNENEELTYSKIWRGSFTDSDLQYLEEYYRNLNNDFKIVTTNHKDYARKIAKASLAMDKAYEDMINGVSGSDKRYKDLKDTFDSLSKSAQFSENTRGQNDVSLGCFGVLFDKVEQKKWIPQHTPLKKDDYDKLIEYFSSINDSV